MSIISGKFLFSVFAAFTVAAGVEAAEKIIYQEDFEESIPGRLPEKWGVVWGEQLDDILAVSSENSYGGDNALLLFRKDKPQQWGFGVPLPKVEKGVATIEFMLLLEGAGNQACMSFEIRDRRDGNPGLCVVTLEDFKILDPKCRPPLNLDRGNWYQLKFSVPVSETDGNSIRFEIADVKNSKSSSMEIPMKEYPQNFGLLCINTQPGKNNFKVFIDNVKVTVK